MTRWWLGLRTWQRGVGVAVALAIVVNLGLVVLSDATGGSGPSGPTSSSYATTSGGLAALAQLAADEGHPVDRLRRAPDAGILSQGGTVVVADPSSPVVGGAATLRQFVLGGGRLVAAGAGTVPLLRQVLGPARAPAWGPSSLDQARPLAKVPEVSGVTTVRMAGAGGSWVAPGATRPVLGDGGQVVATVATVGRGRVVMLSDSSPLQNRFLGTADDAQLALDALGAAPTRVVFDEAVHGYGSGSGLGAVPPRWRSALALAVLAVLAWMWSRARRLGPAQRTGRQLDPARRRYVDALAATLVRTGDRSQVVATVQGEARTRLAARAGLPTDAGEADLRRAGSGLGLAADVLDPLFGPVTGDHATLAVGRALAQVAGGPVGTGPR